MIYRAMIIDDDKCCIYDLQQSLLKKKYIQVGACFTDPYQAKPVLLEEKPDLLFLDVEMPSITGLQFLREIKKEITWPLRVVFYTSYEKYLLEALRESAFDYLLKPFTEEDLKVVMSRFFSFMENDSALSYSLDESLSKVLPDKQMFMVATITGYRILNADQIGYFDYDQELKRWTMHTTILEHLHLKRTVKSEHILALSPDFVQISQQQIINIHYLAMIEGKKCSFYPPFEGIQDSIISRKYYQTMQQYFSMI